MILDRFLTVTVSLPTSTVSRLFQELWLALFQAAIRTLGGDIKDCEKVNEVRVFSDTLVQVRTNNSVFSSTSVVLTCGPWINKLLKPLGLQLPLQVKFRLLIKSYICRIFLSFHALFR